MSSRNCSQQVAVRIQVVYIHVALRREIDSVKSSLSVLLVDFVMMQTDIDMIYMVVVGF